MEKDHIAGIITLHEARGVDRALWPSTNVGDAMRPLDMVHTVTPETPLAEAWEVMGREKVNQLPVVSGGRLEGIISLDHILQVLRARGESQP
jgi:CBS domain-containing protein